MTTPMVGIGHDIVLGLLDPIFPIPSHGSVQVVERGYGISPSIHDQGLFVVFHWDVINGEADYVTLLTAFNLMGNDFADVTVHVKSERLAWTLYNGVAYLPQAGEDMKWQNFFPRQIDLYVCDLETFS